MDIVLVGPGAAFGRQLITYLRKECSGVLYTVGLAAFSDFVVDLSGSQIELADWVQGLKLRPTDVVIFNAKASSKSSFSHQVQVGFTAAATFMDNTSARVILTGGDFKDKPDPSHAALGAIKAALFNLGQTRPNTAYVTICGDAKTKINEVVEAFNTAIYSDSYEIVV